MSLECHKVRQHCTNQCSMQSGDTIEAAGEGKNQDLNGSVAGFKEAC